jgi:thioredoxin-like negative regulator of GroEL
MLGWIKVLTKKFEKMSSPVQVVIAALLIYVCWLMYKLVRYSLFNTGYLENFDNPKTLYYFHMNGCGHCKKFSPTWDQFASKYNGNVQLKKLERAEAGGLLEKYEIQGFPSIILLDDKGQKKEFNGDRTVSGLESFVQN